MKGIRLDIEHKKIIISKKYEKKINSDPDSQEYREYKRIKDENPTFEIEMHNIKKCKGKESYKGLNYDFMYDYIATHVPETKRQDAIERLNEQITFTRCHSRRFPVVRRWFLEAYPEIKENFGKVMAETEERKTIEFDFFKNDDKVVKMDA